MKVDYKVGKCPKCNDEIAYRVSWGGHSLLTPECSCGDSMKVGLKEPVVPDNCVVIWSEREEA